MTRRELGALVLRIAALFLFIAAFKSAAMLAGSLVMYLQFLGNSIFGARSQADNMLLFSMLGQFLQAFLYVMGGIYLARRAETLGAALFAGEDPEGRIATISLEDAQSAAFAVLGIFLAVTGIAMMSSMLPIIRYVMMNSMNDSLWRSVQSSGLTGFVQITLGLVLIFRSRGLAVFLARLRTAAVYPASADPEPEQPAGENDPHS